MSADAHTRSDVTGGALDLQTESPGRIRGTRPASRPVPAGRPASVPRPVQQRPLLNQELEYQCENNHKTLDNPDQVHQPGQKVRAADCHRRQRRDGDRDVVPGRPQYRGLDRGRSRDAGSSLLHDARQARLTRFPTPRGRGSAGRCRCRSPNRPASARSPAGMTCHGSCDLIRRPICRTGRWRTARRISAAYGRTPSRKEQAHPGSNGVREVKSPVNGASAALTQQEFSMLAATWIFWFQSVFPAQFALRSDPRPRVRALAGGARRRPRPTRAQVWAGLADRRLRAGYAGAVDSRGRSA